MLALSPTMPPKSKAAAKRPASQAMLGNLISTDMSFKYVFSEVGGDSTGNWSTGLGPSYTLYSCCFMVEMTTSLAKCYPNGFTPWVPTKKVSSRLCTACWSSVCALLRMTPKIKVMHNMSWLIIDRQTCCQALRKKGNAKNGALSAKKLRELEQVRWAAAYIICIPYPKYSFTLYLSHKYRLFTGVFPLFHVWYFCL